MAPAVSQEVVVSTEPSSTTITSAIELAPDNKGYFLCSLNAELQ